MSASGVARLAVARDEGGGGTLTAAELGKGGTSTASYLDVVTTLIPTGVVAGYTTLLTILLGLVPEPTAASPSPDEQVPLRVVLSVVFAALAFAYVVVDYRAQDGTRTAPLPEAGASTFAFIVWALAMPGTWLVEVIPSDAAVQAFTPAAVAVVGAMVLGLVSGELRKRLPVPPPAPPDPAPAPNP